MPEDEPTVSPLDALGQVLMNYKDSFALVLDTAESIRADLVKKGWSEPMSEQVAGTWLMGMMQKINAAT